MNKNKILTEQEIEEIIQEVEIPQSNEKCEWEFIETDSFGNIFTYHTSCNKKFIYDAVVIICSNFKYCCYCGKEIKMVENG